MNLRTLKKLSKRAALLLPLMGDRREQFPAARGDSYTGLLIMERKHWERGRSVHGDTIGEHMLKAPARDGRGWVYKQPPAHPRKGTVMVGAMSGYYEPEWSEETAWEALTELVHWSFVDFQPETGDVVFTRHFPTPRAIFQGAAEIIAQRNARAGASA